MSTQNNRLDAPIVLHRGTASPIFKGVFHHYMGRRRMIVDRHGKTFQSATVKH